MNLDIQADMNQLNKALSEYIPLSSTAPQQAIARRGTQLAFQLGEKLKEFMPAKGAIRAKGASLLAAGDGVMVRQSIIDRLNVKKRAYTDLNTRKIRYGKRRSLTFSSKGKRLNFRALAVQAELNAREKGRGFSQHVARVGNLKPLATAGAQAPAGSNFRKLHRGRMNQVLASATLRVVPNESSITLLYGSSKTEAGEALSTPKARQAISEAVGMVTALIRSDIEKKYRERARN